MSTHYWQTRRANYTNTGYSDKSDSSSSDSDFDSSEDETIEINFHGPRVVKKDDHSRVSIFITYWKRKLKINTIFPSVIYSLCLMFTYYPMYKYIGKHSKWIKEVADNHIICMKEGGFCAYGNHWIDSMSNKLIRYKIEICESIALRRFRDEEDDDTTSIIGISSSDAYLAKTFCKRKNIFYGIDTEGDKWYNKGGMGKTQCLSYCDEGFDVGDIVTLELDLKKSIISFYINKRWRGIAFGHVRKGVDIKYKLAILLADKYDACVVIDYYEKDQ